MYDELVKRLREMSEWSNIEWEDYSDDAQETMKEAADVIEQLIEERDAYRKAMTDEHNRAAKLAWEKEHCWIPVTERLPEEVRKSYLCRTDSGYHCEVRWTDNVYGLWTGGGGQWGWSIFDIPQYAKVTHWMPLPSTEGLNET